ncbi:hypothetical protein [Tsukamurella hominis]|uniref:hypothetical protein n=1 Tax=Tsukamurella hominis TaxID=1970232 RepID=UPI0039EB329B
MSGGSFNYLYTRTAVALLWDERGAFEMMAELLEKEFPGSAAATRTRELMVLLEAADRGVEAAIDPCREVWQAAEWWKSNDWDREQVEEAVAALEKRVSQEVSTYPLDTDSGWADGAAVVEVVAGDDDGPGVYVAAGEVVDRDRGAVATPDQAEALGWALIAAAARARRQHTGRD